ncbi:hypothetical protein MIND_01346400 [Mycena indigotica]|uniref:FAD/NAD(P)-binding domain-containing protein n=1 Tax=Mycena indigotica TaxID=2126181 RepID=A0A8H6VTP8_9AGAR|nr:uncharacterized protein MIND_01346400 [Mycena indigotica]KAF7289728.1 hypothetical protein MIND_01346400 [Mycena indigotica]
MSEPVSENIPPARPRRVLVIGGGPSGLVTLRNLLERGDFEDVQLVERRDDVGGVWHLDNPKPNTNAKRWPSPAYRGLIGNVISEFLSFSSHPLFPEPPSTANGQPFPSLAETHNYLRAFAAPLLARGSIRLNTEVLKVEELQNRQGWRVILKSGGSELEEKWDAVVVAVAFYDHTSYPDTLGVGAVRQAGLASHAQTWRGPDGYEDKRILVIGNANSGNDITAQLAPVAHAVFQSIRRPNFPGFPSLPDARISHVTPVAEYVVQDVEIGSRILPTVTARLIDNTAIENLNCVIFATGYFPHPDFVHVLQQDGNLGPIVSPQDRHIPSLHRYILYAKNPSLAFVGTAMACYTPFTIADMCSTWLALAWSHGGGVACPTTLPDLLAFERARMDAVAVGRREMAASNEYGIASDLASYCVLGPYEEEYANDLRSDVVKARPELDKVLPVWNEEKTALRDAMFMTKRKALELARKGAVVKDN